MARRASAPKWSSLATLKGPATSIPRLLRQLPSLAERDDALKKLAGLLFDGEQVAEAGAAVLAAIVDIAASTPKPELLLTFVTHLVMLGAPERYALRGVQTDDPRLATPTARAVRAALVACVPRLAPMLESDSPSIRSAAASTLAFASPDEAALQACLAALGCESVAEVRVALILAAMYLLQPGSRDATPIADATRAHDDDLTVGIVTLAKAALDGRFSADLDARLEALCAALFPRLRPRAEAIDPWYPMGVDQLVFTLVGALDDSREAKLRLVRAAMSVVQRQRPSLDNRALRQWTGFFLAWFFTATPDRTKFSRSSDGAAALNADQREVLEVLSGWHDNADWERYGLPKDLRSRRRFLGLDPPRILERSVATPAGEVALWVVVADALAGAEGSERARVRRALPALSTAEELEIWMEIDLGAYGLYAREARRSTLTTLIQEAAPDALDEWRRRYTTELGISWDPSFPRVVGWALSASVSKRSPADAPLPLEVDEWVTATGPNARAELERVPRERRLAIVRRWIAQARPIGAMTTLMTMERVAENLLDLVPEAAELFVTEMERPEQLGNRGMTVGLDNALDQKRAFVPDVDTLLARLQRA